MENSNFEKVRYFIEKKYLGFLPKKEITLNTELSKDLSIEGDDAVDFFEKFQLEFNVDLSNLDLKKYFVGDGFNPFTFLYLKFFKKGKEKFLVKYLVTILEKGKYEEIV